MRRVADVQGGEVAVITSSHSAGQSPFMWPHLTEGSWEL